MSHYQPDSFFQEKRLTPLLEEVESIVSYCRDCNLKLKTTGGRNSHKKLNHEVLEMRILKPNPSPKHNHLIMISKENNPYEIIHGVDFSG